MFVLPLFYLFALLSLLDSLECGHTFCSICLESTGSLRRCPQCRSSICSLLIRNYTLQDISEVALPDLHPDIVAAANSNKEQVKELLHAARLPFGFLGHSFCNVNVLSRAWNTLLYYNDSDYHQYAFETLLTPG